MTDITHEQIRDSLPDLVNARLDSESRAQIESHLRSCAECASEVRVLQMVKNAPSFAPMIDAVKVSSSILPYGGIPAERPKTTTRVWQTLAALAAVVLVGVTVISRDTQDVRVPAGIPSKVALGSSPKATPAQVVTRTDSPARNAAAAAPKPRELQVAVGLDGLSDGSLAQLASEIGSLDGLPSSEPENLGVADPNSGGGS